MSILLGLLLSQARVLPEIDRRALELQARAESLQGRPAPRRAAAPAPRRPLATVETVVRRTADVAPRRSTTAAAPVRRAAVQTGAIRTRPGMPMLRRASGGAMDLASITTICRAAGGQNDPATYLASYSRAFSLSGTESSSLRTSCAAYLAGRADARVNNYAR